MPRSVIDEIASDVIEGRIGRNPEKERLVVMMDGAQWTKCEIEQFSTRNMPPIAIAALKA